MRNFTQSIESNRSEIAKHGERLVVIIARWLCQLSTQGAVEVLRKFNQLVYEAKLSQSTRFYSDLEELSESFAIPFRFFKLLGSGGVDDLEKDSRDAALHIERLRLFCETFGPTHFSLKSAAFLEASANFHQEAEIMLKLDPVQDGVALFEMDEEHREFFNTISAFLGEEVLRLSRFLEQAESLNVPGLPYSEIGPRIVECDHTIESMFPLCAEEIRNDVLQLLNDQVQFGETDENLVEMVMKERLCEIVEDPLTQGDPPDTTVKRGVLVDSFSDFSAEIARIACLALLLGYPNAMISELCDCSERAQEAADRLYEKFPKMVDGCFVEDDED